MKTILKFHKLTLTEALNMSQNRPLWQLLAMSGAAHSCGTQARYEDDSVCPSP